MTDALTSIAVVRAAILSEIDRVGWKFYEAAFEGYKDPEAEVNIERMDFADAVERRIQELQSPPLSLGLLGQGRCSRHLWALVPHSASVRCPECATELALAKDAAKNSQLATTKIESQES